MELRSLSRRHKDESPSGDLGYDEYDNDLWPGILIVWDRFLGAAW